jgi:hypothetical protein
MDPFGADPDVNVGAMLYTLVDPEKGLEVDYNRWYERDHFYSGCMVGPWLFAGRRWVSTRELKDLRFPGGVASEAAVADPLDAGSYLATYFIHGGHEAEHFAWANKQVFELYEHDRGFEGREHAHTSLYFAVGNHREGGHSTVGSHSGGDSSAGDDGVPAHMALDHPYNGLVSIHLDRAEGVRHEQYAEWFAESVVPHLLDDGPVDLVLDWRPIIPKGAEGDAPMKLGTGPGTRQRGMHLCFLREDPRDGWGAFVDAAEQINKSGLAEVVLVAPFIPTIPGTDRYTDELW